MNRQTVVYLDNKILFRNKQKIPKQNKQTEHKENTKVLKEHG